MAAFYCNTVYSSNSSRQYFSILKRVRVRESVGEAEREVKVERKRVCGRGETLQHSVFSRWCLSERFERWTDLGYVASQLQMVCGGYCRMPVVWGTVPPLVCLFGGGRTTSARQL